MKNCLFLRDGQRRGWYRSSGERSRAKEGGEGKRRSWRPAAAQILILFDSKEEKKRRKIKEESHKESEIDHHVGWLPGHSRGAQQIKTGKREGGVVGASIPGNRVPRKVVS